MADAGALDVGARAESVRRDGFCLIPDVLAPDACASLHRRLVAIAAEHRNDGAYAEGVSFVPGVINHDQSFAACLADDRVLAACTALLGAGVRVSFTSALMNEPGKRRSAWHGDWPFNQNNAGHIRAPYADCLMHLTALLMVTPFDEANGGTMVVPGSHRAASNPTDPSLGVDPLSPYPTEYRVTGPQGTLVLFDSRLWHCAPANRSDHVRIALGVRYAPWWLDLTPLDPDSAQRRRLVEATGKSGASVPRLPRAVYEALPVKVKPLYEHWLCASG